MGQPVSSVDPKIKEWASESQCRYIDAVNAYGSMRAASRALGVNIRAVSQAVHAAMRRAAIKGYAPTHDMTRPVPDVFDVKGVSTYYNKDGKPSGQWVKSRLNTDRREEVVREAIATLSEEVRGLSPLIAAPERVCADLLAVYPMGDPHFGLYAWAKETGESFDLETAKRLTLSAIDRLLASAPPAHTAIVLPLGDVFHADDQTNQTPAHKHQLDVDSRFTKVLGVGIEAYRHVILRALQKHQKVIVRFVQGNHDPHSVWALAFTMAAYFSHETRVEIDLSPSKFWFYRFGQVLIGATHGDTVKHDKLLGIMATDRAPDWGETKHRFWYTGHVHSTTVTELPGVICESFRTLAARDAYAAGHGYRAGRDMVCIVHHRDHGEVERHRCDVGMIE